MLRHLHCERRQAQDCMSSPMDWMDSSQLRVSLPRRSRRRLCMPCSRFRPGWSIMSVACSTCVQAPCSAVQFAVTTLATETQSSMSMHGLSSPTCADRAQTGRTVSRHVNRAASPPLSASARTRLHVVSDRRRLDGQFCDT